MFQYQMFAFQPPYVSVVMFVLIWCRPVLSVCAEVQTMRVAPVDTSVKQGEMVVLGCEVDHIKGNLQWAKGGILLGDISII